jgi:ABC-type antimicrobial peptide transport system permease subunit
MPLMDIDRRAQLISVSQQWTRDAHMGLQNLMLHGLRSLLTMLGMIFGVAAVVAMLSIGAGARQKVMALIEQMGARNLIVEAKETTEWQAYQNMRKISPGLTLLDYRVIGDDVSGIVASTPRKRMTPSKMIPKPQQGTPVIYGVNPEYQGIAGLQLVNGRFFSENDENAGAPVCELGATAKWSTVMVAIASISLLVGGIGIMNIMLASILERTREIGLRRAVGARRSNIVRQFVVESTMISFAGGTIGVVVGFVISRSIAWLAGWSTIVTFSSISLAFLVSISVGLVFGIYPAAKAAGLDPVEAIRYE